MSVFKTVSDLKFISVFKNDNGILRVKTKITYRKDYESFLAPILLPGKCLFTRLIKSVHIENFHAGIQLVQTILRKKFWILRTRKTIRNVLYECVKCKLFGSKPMSNEPTPLPPDRVSDCDVFEIVVFDLAGPLFLKNGEKVWIALFTCAVYGAIHLELVRSLSSNSFNLAMRRFIVRRGRPKTIYSENGTNFKGPCNELSNLDWNQIQREDNLERMSRKFNPPTASWWERLARVITELLRRTLGNSVLPFEELQTVICGCESVVNSKPLTYILKKSWELVPLMFLIENCCLDVTDFEAIDQGHFQIELGFVQNF
ncbi:hypothetical protein AVEN_142283-1 [Araneus ventricosus]|uniref:Integrase catalytic domain-containing protein n=1 Tax=Araneus ventricosus TaxID=182803 RepID=A0A4Y2N0E8_ARAVE|nr:hypothetical protein AVEN_142283-1 [Araneus ventricosus]